MRWRWLAALALPLLAVAARADAPATPNHFDPRARPPAPPAFDRVLRVMTDDDYPPFQFIGLDGALIGFNVDLARAVCEDLRAACTIQTRRWDTLIDALIEERGDLVFAGHRASAELRRRVETSAPYLKTPARFVARRAATQPDPAAPGARIAVVVGSAHQVYAGLAFQQAQTRPVETLEGALGDLVAGSVDAVFGDGVALSLWLNGPQGSVCCRFVGGPWFESRFFGEGLVALTRRRDAGLARAVDGALQRLTETGRLAELYRRYFPIGFY